MNDINKKIGEKIKKAREQSGITQQKLAEMLGVARPTISQIENGERKISADELIKLSEIFDISVETLLDIKKPLEVILEKNKKHEKKKTKIRVNVPQRNVERFEEVLLYILNKVGSKLNIGETVIYKLLYFIDFDYYEKYEQQLIGASYIKNRYGPTPVEFVKIVDKMIKDNKIMKIPSQYFEYPQTKYIPLKKPDLSKLTGSEMKEVIDDVLNRLSDMNANQISEYSHKDVPFLTTEDGEIIEYESVFYRAPEYSVRDYKDEIPSDY